MECVGKGSMQSWVPAFCHLWIRSLRSGSRSPSTSSCLDDSLIFVLIDYFMGSTVEVLLGVLQECCVELFNTGSGSI